MYLFLTLFFCIFLRSLCTRNWVLFNMPVIAVRHRRQRCFCGVAACGEMSWTYYVRGLARTAVRRAGGLPLEEAYDVERWRPLGQDKEAEPKYRSPRKELTREKRGRKTYASGNAKPRSFFSNVSLSKNTRKFPRTAAVRKKEKKKV